MTHELPVASLPTVSVHNLTLVGQSAHPRMVTFTDYARGPEHQLPIERIHNRTPLRVRVTVPPGSRGVLHHYSGKDVILQGVS